MGYRTILIGMALCALPVTASAHVVFAEPTARAGGYHAAFLRIGHGCGGSDTVSVRVEIPAGIASARPQPKPGWTLTVERQPLAVPVKTEGGGEQRERVSAILWTGRLPADQFDQFGIMMKLPREAGALYFPTVQTCVVGVNAWAGIPATPQAWRATPMPAPMLLLEPAMEGHGGH